MKESVQDTAIQEAEGMRYATVNHTKRYLCYIGILVVAVLLIVALFGRMEFHTELERQVLPHTLIGYIEEEYDTGTVMLSDVDWPDWALPFECAEEGSVELSSTQLDGRIGIFADLVYYENRYEKRSWLTGRLITRASEYYYKPEGTLYLDVVYERNQETEISLDEIVPQEYDFMAFRGTK